MGFSIGALAQIPRGEGRNFRVGDRVVAVFHSSAGAVYASQPDCPHRQGPLADGLMGGPTIVCPLHDRSWNLATGESLTGDCAITVYPARVEDGQVVVDLPG